MARRYWIETYGCQMNKAESGSLEVELQARGWEPAGEAGQADVVVVNTCSVRQSAEDRLWGRLGFLKTVKRRRPFRLVLMGCMAERLKDEIFAEAPQVDVVVGSFQKHRLGELLDAEAGGGGEPFGGREGRPSTRPPTRRRLALTDADEYHFAERHSPGELRAFVPVMHGCDNFCTYCIVPYVRGREVSRSPASILAEVRSLVPPHGAARDITLLGQNVNSYRFGGDKADRQEPAMHASARKAGPGGLAKKVLDFPSLLELVLAELPPGIWLRFLTSHPKDMSDELIRLIAEQRALCRHIHLPVQHGSDRVLEGMGRRYTRTQYLSLVERIRAAVPGVSLTTDLMVGFPGESEEDHRLTLELMKAVEFDDAFTYRYNPREGTRAFLLGDDVPDPVKRDRLSEVIELQRGISRERRRRRLGNVVPVLVEGISKKDPEELLARTEGDDTVVFPGGSEKIGSFARVALERLAGNTFRGRERTDGV